MRCHAASPIQVKESASVEWAKQQAFDYLRTKHKKSCRSKQPERYVSGTMFQEKLFELNHKYTLARLFRLDDSIQAAAHLGLVSDGEERSCAFTVEFSKYLIDDFLLCEVFPKGEGTFIISEVFAFKLENHKAVLMGKQTINYN